MYMFTLQSITSIDQFISVKDRWDSLYSRALEKFPMLTHNWLESWWYSFGNDMVFYVILVSEGENLVGAAPFCYSKTKIIGLPCTQLQFLRNERVDRMQILVDKDIAIDKEKLSTLIDRLFKHISASAPRHDIIQLKNVVSSSLITDAILNHLRKSGSRFSISKGLTSPYLPLSQNWDETLGCLSPTFRQTVKRKLRKAEKTQGLSSKIYRDSSFIGPLMEVSANTWQHEEGTCMGSKQNIKLFYENIIRDADKNGCLYSAILALDDKPIAFEFNLICNDTLHNFKLGFDKNYKDLSAGLILKSHIIQRLLTDDSSLGIKEYDFMGEATPYKLNWSREVRELITVDIYSSSIKVLVYYFLKDKVKPLIKKFLKGKLQNNSRQ